MADTYEYLKEIGRIREEVKTLSDSPIHQIMQKWSRDAIDVMKKNTPKASGALAASIGFKFSANGGVLTVDFLADDYWDYVNSGVDGVRGGGGAIGNKFGKTYSFKSEVPSRKMIDSFVGLGKQNWMAAHGITSLTYGGETYQLTSDEDYRSAAYVFARAVKRNGIKASNFVGKAVNDDTIKLLEKLLIDALSSMF